MFRLTVAVACFGALGAVQATPDMDAAKCSSDYALAMMDPSILTGANHVSACGAIVLFSRCLGRLSNSGASNLAAQQQILDAANAHFSCDYASYIEPPTVSARDQNLEIEVDGAAGKDVVFHRMRRETISIWDLNARVVTLDADFNTVRGELSTSMVNLAATVAASASTITADTEAASAAQTASVSAQVDAVVSTVTATVGARCDIATQYVKITATGNECTNFSPRCAEGFWESKAPGLYSDRECSKVQDCDHAGGYKEGEEPTYTFPGNCSAFKRLWFRLPDQGYDMYPVLWPTGLRYHQRDMYKVCQGKKNNNPVPFKNMKPWRDQWPRFDDNSGRDGSWEDYAYRRSGYNLGSHDIQYKFRCIADFHQCHGHPGHVTRQSVQLNDDMLDMGFQPHSCPVMGMIYHHSGSNGDHCSYIQMCIGNRGDRLRSANQQNWHCNRHWGQLAARGVWAPDFVLCAVNSPYISPEGENMYSPLDLDNPRD